MSGLDGAHLEAALHADLIEVDDGSPPMDSSWYGYVIVFCCFVIYFIVFGIEHTFGVYQEYYGSPSAEPWLRNTSEQGITMIGTLGTTFTYLLGAFSGRFADMVGYRVTTVLGAVIMGMGMIGASFATSLSTLYICQGVILGVGSSLVYLPAVSCPAHWFERYRSVAIGVVVCGSGLGGLVLGPLTQYLITSVGVQWTLRIQGMLCLFGIGGSGMMLKTRVKRVPGQYKRAPMDFTICKEVPFIALTMANFLTSLGYMIPFFFLSAFSVFHGQTSKTGALLIGIMNGASLLGRLSLSFVTDRVGRINMLFICALISGLSILCIWSVASSVTVLTVFSVVYGFTCGGYFSVIPSVIADIYGLDRLTTVTGLLYGSIGFGYLIGSPVSAWLLDITKPNTTYIYVVIFSGGAMTLSSFAVFYLKYWRSKGRWWIHG
ncbi:MAG: major facilitator superfamily domain-containing protein [Linnemannia gamsii]|nr:MAG: major facilitator superfamily domain-containing protein [Linnemannia gamsii]